MRRQMESQLPPTAGPSTTTSKGPAANLAARRNAGEVHADPVQEKVVQKLQAIYEQLVAMADHPAPRPGLALHPPPSRRLDRAGSTSGDRSAAASRC